MTIEAYEPWIGQLRTTLEAEHAAHTERLTELAEASDDTEWESAEGHTRSALLASTQQNLAAVTEALQRIAEGRYGRCEKCGGSIPRERLEILPHARSCVPCQERAGR